MTTFPFRPLWWAAKSRRCAPQFLKLRQKLALAAGVDQSRISRIEKGEGTPTELGKLLAGLSALGSSRAQEFEAFLKKTWRHIERPDFSNPQRTVVELAEETLERVQQFLAQEHRPWPLKRQLERQEAAIETAATYLAKTTHQIAYVGEIGVGKSTAISFIYGLLDSTATRGELMEQVVLETGGGRTTLCEVSIRRGPGYGIAVQPLSDKETWDLVADFCAVNWLRRPGAEVKKNEIVNVSEEKQRALRVMSQLPVKRERDASGKTISRDLALELAGQCGTEEDFRARVLERMKLELRTRREIWIEDTNEKIALPQLRKLFKDINNGRLEDVPFPASIDIIIPGFGAELPGLAISAIDTKGLDEILVRADLDARLKDARTHVVLCSTFNQAPSASVQLLIDHLRNSHGIRPDGGKLSVLVLPRDNEAMAVKDDSGLTPVDELDGYTMKQDQILRSQGGEGGALHNVPIRFFNVRKDDSATLRTQINNEVVDLRKAYEQRLLDECAAVDEIIANHEKKAFTGAVEAVAESIGRFLKAHTKVPARLRQPSTEVSEALTGIRYASTIWAMTRRNGEYYSFSVSHHLGAGGARDALLRSGSWFDKLQAILDTLKQDKDLVLAKKTIQQVERGARSWQRNFAEASRTATVEVYREPLESDQAFWSECASQWGKGPGFKNRVKTLVDGWFETHPDLVDDLESVIASLWEANVLQPLKRLSDENAGEEKDSTSGSKAA